MPRRYGSWFLLAIIGSCSAVAAFAGGRLIVDRFTHGSPVAIVPAVIELGDHENGKTVIPRVRVANSGTAELVLQRFASSCGCAAVEVERDGELRPAELIRVPPGGQVELAARVTVVSRPGTSQRVQIAFSTNDPKAVRPVVELVVGRVTGGVITAPLAVVFGDQPSGTTTSRFVRVYENGIKGRQLSAVRSLNPNRFSATLLPQREGQKQESDAEPGLIGVIEVTPVAGHVGSLDGRIELRMADEERPSQYIEVIGHAVGPVITLPDALVLPRAAGEERRYDGRVRVSARDGKAVAVKAQPMPEGWSVSVARDPETPGGQLVQIARSSRTPPAGGSFTLVLSVSVDGGQVVPVTVPVYVRGEVSHE